MMKHAKEIFLLFFLILFTSCRSTSTLSVADFKTNHSLSNLTGTYWSGHPHFDKNLAYIMMGGFIPDQSIDYVSLRFNGKDALTVKFLSNSKVIKELKYKGKIKDNFFEIYFRKNPFVLPPILVNYNYSRVRLGLTENNELRVHFWRDKTNGTLLFYSTEKQDKSYVFERLSEDVRSLQQYGYDGMTDSDSENFRKVRNDSLWALANDSGKLITGFDYDFIGPYDRNISGYLVVSQSASKCNMGYINTSGKQIITMMYDALYDTNVGNLKMTSQEGKIGFTFSGDVICPTVLTGSSEPPVFEKLDVKGADPNLKYCLVHYKGTDYYLGFDGYLYPYSVNTLTRKLWRIKSQHKFKPGR